MDKVSVPITADHSVVYQCDSDVHNSKWCNQYEPGNDWAMGWKLIGYCEGTIAPSSSPNFSSLDEMGDGCPKTYNVRTIYETGDQVSLFISNDPVRAIIYECKTWPNGAYCNAGPRYSPGSDNADMGWTLKGYCDGTIAPTAAPIVYTPAVKCRWYNGTRAITIYNWAKSSLSTYISGTRVRKSDRIYKCKGWPNGLWCKLEAYEPEETDFWRDAWSSAGHCDIMFEPTTSPSASPTSSPSSSPTSGPTTTPSASPTSSPSKSPVSPTTSPSESPSASPTTSPSTTPSKSPSSSPTETFDWQQLGSDIDGEAVGDQSGYSVSLSDDGSTLAIGAHQNDGNGSASGHVRVYDWNDPSWVKRGSDIDGEAAGDQSGYSVSLSDDGNTVAIGGNYNDANGDKSGHVRVYDWNGSSWEQRGNDIDGEAAGDESGNAVSLSGDGNIVAIAARNNRSSFNVYFSGHVRVYSWNGSIWEQIGSDIDSETASDRAWSVSLSGDGSTVAFGAPGNDGNGDGSGNVRVFS